DLAAARAGAGPRGIVRKSGRDFAELQDSRTTDFLFVCYRHGDECKRNSRRRALEAGATGILLLGAIWGIRRVCSFVAKAAAGCGRKRANFRHGAQSRMASGG